MAAQDAVTEDMTVVDRLQRLQRVTEMSLENVEDGDTAHDEVFHGLDNIRNDLKEVNDDDQRTCGHCGSNFTYLRSDGDTACHDCPGIMPNEVRDR